MRIISYLIISLSFFAMIGLGAAQQPSVSSEITQNQFQAGETHKVANFTIENPKQNDTIVMSNTAIDSEELITWNFQYTPKTAEIANQSQQKISLNATIPENFQAGTYEAEAAFDFDDAIDQISLLEFKVAESQQWNITNSTVKDNVSVSTEGNIGQYTLENIGNTDVTVNQTINGEISEYVSVADQVTLFPQIPETRTLAYDIPEDTQFGNYTGNLTVSSEAENQTKTLNLSIEVLDDISPNLKSKSFPSFEATQPEKFTVDASDNLEVESITADITYEDNTGNQTGTETLETAEFTYNNETEIWEYNISEDRRPDEYDVEGTIKDTAGNTRDFEDEFTVSKLSSFEPNDIIELPRYQSGAEINQKISELETSTGIGITLESLKGNLTDYQIGIQIDPFKTEDDEETEVLYYDEIGDTVTVDQKSNVSLVVFGEKAERFNGQLDYSHPDYHKEILSSQFQGEFTDFVTPQDTEFEVSGIKYDCDGSPSESAANSTWNCEFEVSAEEAGEVNQLEEAVDIVVPQEAREQQEEKFNSQLEEMEQKVDDARMFRNFSIFGGLLLFVVTIYINRYHPSHYSINRERSKSEKMNIAGTIKKKLGLGEN